MGAGVVNPDASSMAGDAITSHEKARSLTAEVLRLLGIERVIDVDDSWQGDASPDIDLIIAAVDLGAIPLDVLHLREDLRPLITDADGQLLPARELADKLRNGTVTLPDDVARELTDIARIASAEPPDSRGPAEQPRSTHIIPTQPTVADANIASAASADFSDAKERPVDDLGLERRSDMATLMLLRELIEPGAEFVPLTLSAWRSKGRDILRDEKATLVLFDQDFSGEGGTTNDGEKVLSSLLSRADLAHVSFGLLTHRVDSLEDEQRMAAEIVERYSTAPNRVIVIAKSRILREPQGIATALRVALVAEELDDLRQRMQAALQMAGGKAAEAIDSLDPWSAMAMISAARYEGVHEPEGMLRVALTAHRRSLARETRVAAVTEGPLLRLRTALDIDLRPSGMRKPSEHWRLSRENRYDSAEHLSALRLPLETGDIFRIRKSGPGERIVNETAERFVILLVQPCDVIVRSDGKRGYDPKLMTVAHLRPTRVHPDGRKDVRDNEVELEDFDPAIGTSYVARLAERLYLPTYALDACVFSEDGTSEIVVGQAPSAKLSVSWRRRYEHIQKWAGAVVRKYAAMGEVLRSADQDLRRRVCESLTGASREFQELGVSVEADTKTVRFGLARVARLTDRNARALLTLASQHQARPALDGPLIRDIDEDD